MPFPSSQPSKKGHLARLGGESDALNAPFVEPDRCSLVAGISPSESRKMAGSWHYG